MTWKCRWKTVWPAGAPLPTTGVAKPAEVRQFEPVSALTSGGPEGAHDLERIIAEAKPFLAPAGLRLRIGPGPPLRGLRGLAGRASLEHGARQGERQSHPHQNGPFLHRQ